MAQTLHSNGDCADSLRYFFRVLFRALTFGHTVPFERAVSQAVGLNFLEIRTVHRVRIEAQVQQLLVNCFGGCGRVGVAETTTKRNIWLTFFKAPLVLVLVTSDDNQNRVANTCVPGWALP